MCVQYHVLLVSEERKAMSQLPFVTSQTKSSEFIHSSLHEENVLAVALENEWDLEWNQMGMASRLSQEVSLFDTRLFQVNLRSVRQ